MFLKNKSIFIILIILLSNCSINNLNENGMLNNVAVHIETPTDKDNVLLKENLRRLIKSNPNSELKYVLIAKISYSSSETLSVRGLSVLNSTKATVDYSLVERSTGNILKESSFNSFPALSSSSNSLYSNEKSIDQIKERLNLSSAEKLNLLLKITLSRLN
jgi:hypothetical protein